MGWVPLWQGLGDQDGCPYNRVQRNAMGALMTESRGTRWVPLRQSPAGVCSSPSTKGGHGEKVPSLTQKAGPQQTLNLQLPWSWSPKLRNHRNRFLLFISHLIHDILLYSLKILIKADYQLNIIFLLPFLPVFTCLSKIGVPPDQYYLQLLSMSG